MRTSAKAFCLRSFREAPATLLDLAAWMIKERLVTVCHAFYTQMSLLVIPCVRTADEQSENCRIVYRHLQHQLDCRNQGPIRSGGSRLRLAMSMYAKRLD